MKQASTLATVVIGWGALMLVVTVRADAPIDQFTPAAGGTVLDNQTGLVWQQDFSPPMQSQAMALAYCDGLTIPGGVWRLPSVLELASLVDETRAGSGNPAIDTAIFPMTPGEYFWTSSPLVGDATRSWAVSFYDGAVGDHISMNLYLARCVR